MLRHLLILALLFVLAGCHTTPISQRKQLLFIPEQQEVTLGMQAYEEILAEETVSSNPHFVEMVQRVGKRIADVSGHDEYLWEFRVLDSREKNAFALPGGKVAVYEGILPVCQNEAGLAVVMSHEIGHAIARHGGERMTQQGLVNVTGKVVDLYSQDRDEKERQRIRAIFGAASQYGYILPYSRKHESEADEIGLILMARAGYDPREAPRFWERFSRLGGEKPPEFVSTHPSDQRRAADLKAMLPEAMGEYEKAPEQYQLGKPIFHNSEQKSQQASPNKSTSAGSHVPRFQPEENHLDSQAADPFRPKS